MAVFNFEIKRQSYDIAVGKVKESLNSNDISSAKIYIEKAITLCTDLINHCVVIEIKEKYINERNTLKKLQSDLNNNVNPYKEPNNTTSINSKEPEVTFFKKESPKVTLKDVAGLESVKEEIKMNVLVPMQHPDLYYLYQDKLGCHILLYGPPGCGKSFIAEAVAGELKCAYAIINASDILDKYVGEAPKKIVQIFEEAKQYDKCLIFFDEIDALCSSRDSDDSRYTKEVLTTFLTCLSGFNNNANKDQIKIVMGATNRPWALDKALIRGKRLDTLIYVTVPDAQARKFLVEKVYKKHPSIIKNTDLTLNEIVEKLEGYSCADIETILYKVNTLALKRTIMNKEKGIDSIESISKKDFEAVIKNYQNTITPESLELFAAFKKGEI